MENANGNSCPKDVEKFNTVVNTPMFVKLEFARLILLTANVEELFSCNPTLNAVGSRRVMEDNVNVALGSRDVNIKNAELSLQNAHGLAITLYPKRNTLAHGRRLKMEDNVNAVHTF
jgi:hypothetical protein